jgi:phytoene dehydrogenase-like protein
MIGKEHLPPEYVAELQNLKIGLSAFQIFLGVNRDFSEYFGNVHEISVAESWDQEKNFHYITKGVPEKAGMGIINYSMIDPTTAPPGKNVIVITSILPYDWESSWYLDSGYTSYQQFKEDVARKYIERAEEYLPGLSNSIEVMEVGTPYSMKGFTLNPKGSIFGWSNIPEQSMMGRLRQETPIPNLYLAGAWTFPGGGQSAVIQSGVMAADLILKEEKQRIVNPMKNSQ